MIKRNLLLASSLVLTVFLANNSWAAPCRDLALDVEQKEQRLSNIASKIEQAERGIQVREREISSMSYEVDAAERDYRIAERELDQLREEYRNADYLIRSQQSTITQINSSLPSEVARETQLRDAYKSIEVKFSTMLKRAQARAKWKEQEDRVASLRNQLVSANNEITRLRTLKTDFNRLEDLAIDKVERAERRMRQVEGQAEEIRELRREVRDLQAELSDLRERRSDVEARLFRSREELKQCQAGGGSSSFDDFASTPVKPVKPVKPGKPGKPGKF